MPIRDFDSMKIQNLEKPAFLVKPNGKRIAIKAEIQTKTAYITDINCPIEIDDILERPRGEVYDRYIVTNILPWDNSISLGLIEPHIQASIVPYRKNVNAPINMGNINAERVYVNSSDNSINVIVEDNETENKFRELKETIASILGETNSLTQMVDELYKSVHSQSYKDRYQEFMSNVANHVTVLQGIAPFMGWLGSLL